MNEMGQFEFSKVLMEKILRRAFLDGVIELYENCPYGRIYSVALEGDLSLTINKYETFDIRLFEIAQRAPEKPHLNKSVKTEASSSKMTVKKEDIKPKIKSEINRVTSSCDKKLTSPENVATVLSASEVVPEKSTPVQSVNSGQAVDKDELMAVGEVKSVEITQTADKAVSKRQLVGISDVDGVEMTQTVDKTVNKDVPVSTDEVVSSIEKVGSGEQVSADMTVSTKESLITRVTVCTGNGGVLCSAKESLCFDVSTCDPHGDAAAVDEHARDDGLDGDVPDKNQTELNSKTPDNKVCEEDDTECQLIGISSRGCETILIDDEEEISTKGRPEMLSLPRHKRRRTEQKQTVEKKVSYMAEVSQISGSPADRFYSTCPLCSALFQERDYFILHVEAHRQHLGQSCLICSQGNLQTEGYLYHLATHHGTSIIQAAAELSGVARQPQFPVVKSEGEFRCLQCGRDFLTIGMLESHAESHRQEDLEEERQMLRAEKLESDREKMLRVGKLESEREILLRVEKLKSEREKMIRVEKLDLEMIQAEKTDSKKMSYGCELCSDVFSHPSSLAEHHRQEHGLQVKGQMSLYMNDHTDDNSSDDVTVFSHKCLDVFTCHRCGRSFRSWRSLKYHYLTTHGLQYTCEVCRNAFSTQRHLQLHEESHVSTLTEPVFKCNICDKTFPTATHCTAHKRSHTSAKPHTCDLCGSCFFKRGDLTKHVRTVHCPKKHFVCKVCGRTGTRSDNMRVHVKLHQKFMSRDQVDQLIEEVYNKQ